MSCLRKGSIQIGISKDELEWLVFIVEKRFRTFKLIVFSAKSAVAIGSVFTNSKLILFHAQQVLSVY